MPLSSWSCATAGMLVAIAAAERIASPLTRGRQELFVLETVDCIVVSESVEVLLLGYGEDNMLEMLVIREYVLQIGATQRC
jgi:hypothetical protein